MPKTTFKNNISEERKCGRPKKSWIQDVVDDLIKVTGWWEKAERREEWRQIVKATLAHIGL